MFAYDRCRFSLLLCSLIGLAILWTVPLSGAEPPAPPVLKSQIMRWDDAKSHSGDWGEMRRYFVGQTAATKDVLVAVAVVQPGKAVHYAHRHAEEEYLALVEGSGVWSLDGKDLPAERGDILYVEPWIYHGLTNTGDTPLIFLVVRYNGKGTPTPPRPDDRPNELRPQAKADATPSLQPAKVTGTVTLDGKPLAGATIVFRPQKGRPASGVTDGQGRYSLSTSAKDDGALPGVYRVTIAADSQDPAKSNEPQSNRRAADKPAIPARYSNPATTGLTTEVCPGPNVFDFELKSR